jgi:hypothetical protein
MGPRSRLGWAEAIILRFAERVVETQAPELVNGRVFEERFASKVVVRMMVMMMIRAGHLEGRMLERNVLAGDGLCGMCGVRMRACVSMIGECAATRECTAGSASVCESGSVRTRRGASTAHSRAAKMTGGSTTAVAAATATAAPTRTAARMSAAAAGRRGAR